MNKFSCIGVANTQATCSDYPPKQLGVSGRLSHIPYLDLSNPTWAQRKRINEITGNACDNHGTQATHKVQ